MAVGLRPRVDSTTQLAPSCIPNTGPAGTAPTMSGTRKLGTSIENATDAPWAEQTASPFSASPHASHTKQLQVGIPEPPGLRRGRESELPVRRHAVVCFLHRGGTRTCLWQSGLESQQFAEGLAVGDLRRPTVCGPHSGVKGRVCVREPQLQAVEVRQCVLPEGLGGVGGARTGRFGWPAPARPPTRPSPGGEPSVPEFDAAPGFQGYNHMTGRVPSVIR